ncbi:MAG: alpha-ketoacid dehydrogenase subunit beta, partial [Deltaproteobacteria bacterium]|nr:alpha-ketoacid dehydrogenase subunit beta [Deltaproteobacteria bacterium]
MTGENKVMAKLNMVEAINLALREEMERDGRVIVLGEDVGKEGGVFRVTDGLQEKFGPDRVIDTPLAEAAIVATAFGMAMNGLRPVAEIQFDGFLYPCLDQITNHIGRIRNRSRGRFTCPLVIRVPYGGGIHAPEHHSESPEAILAHTPGIKVVIPSTPHEAKGLLLSSIRDPDPVIFLEPKRIYRAIREEVQEGDYTISLGKARLVQEGKDVTVIAWGAMVREALNAAEQMKADKVDVEIIDLRT